MQTLVKYVCSVQLVGHCLSKIAQSRGEPVCTRFLSSFFFWFFLILSHKHTVLHLSHFPHDTLVSANTIPIKRVTRMSEVTREEKRKGRVAGHAKINLSHAGETRNAHNKLSRYFIATPKGHAGECKGPTRGTITPAAPFVKILKSGDSILRFHKF